MRELIGRRLDAALTFCLEPTPGLARRLYSQERMQVLMRRGHRLSGAEVVRLEQLHGDRFVVPAEDLSPGFNRRLRALCSEHGFEPATSVATVIWDDDEWPAGADVVTLVNEGWARHVPDRLRSVRLEPELRLPVEVVWREDDDSPLLKTFLDVTS